MSVLCPWKDPRWPVLLKQYGAEDTWNIRLGAILSGGLFRLMPRSLVRAYFTWGRRWIWKNNAANCGVTPKGGDGE